MLYEVIISFKISSQPTCITTAPRISSASFLFFIVSIRFGLKQKCSQCARPQKEFRSFQYIWPPPCSPQAYKRREWPLLKTHHSRDKRLWRTRRFDLRLLPVQCSPHHFPGLFTGSKPSPSVWRLSSTRLWVLLWFPPTPSLKATEYFLSVGWHHLQEKWICFLLWVSLALSPNPLFSVYLFSETTRRLASYWSGFAPYHNAHTLKSTVPLPSCFRSSS